MAQFLEGKSSPAIAWLDRKETSRDLEMEGKNTLLRKRVLVPSVLVGLYALLHWQDLKLAILSNHQPFLRGVNSAVSSALEYCKLNMLHNVLRPNTSNLKK